MVKEQYQEIMDRLLDLGEDYFLQYEDFRDEIHALGPKVMPHVLESALDEQFAFALDLLVTILADTGYPPAMPYFVAWLDHSNEEIRFASACALDAAAGEKFDVVHMIERGWVQHDKVAEAIPALKTWWREEGEANVPSEWEWYGQQVLKPKYTEREKLYNFIELNPTWAVLGSGVVLQPKEPLPRDQGIHIVGGTVQVKGEAEPRLAAIELDSNTGQIYKIFVKERGYWIEVSDKSTQVELKCHLVELPDELEEPVPDKTQHQEGWFSRIGRWLGKTDK